MDNTYLNTYMSINRKIFTIVSNMFSKMLDEEDEDNVDIQIIKRQSDIWIQLVALYTDSVSDGNTEISGKIEEIVNKMCTKFNLDRGYIMDELTRYSRIDD